MNPETATREEIEEFTLAVMRDASYAASENLRYPSDDGRDYAGSALDIIQLFLSKGWSAHTYDLGDEEIEELRQLLIRIRDGQLNESDFGRSISCIHQLACDGVPGLLSALVGHDWEVHD